MTATTNAAGGRIWQHQPKPKVSAKLLKNGLFAWGIAIIVFTGVSMGAMALSQIASAPAQVINSTNSSIELSYTGFNQSTAEEQIKTWVPTALGLQESTVNKVLLESLKDGAIGSVFLTNGDAIPFTLHNEDDVRFTIDKG